MARGFGGGGSIGEDDADKYKNAPDAKHLFDMIGEKVYEEELKKESKTYMEELKGSLSQVSTNAETASTADPCTFEYTEHTSGAKGNMNPCGNDGKGNDVERFSDKQGAQCDYRKIRDSKNYCGACAPFRRLNLCNKNIEKMVTNNNDGKDKHDLLAEVCYAAKFEGDSITRDYPKYQATYEGSGFTLCTMLARSFADIGDIIRGRDLYIANNRGRKKLDDKLKEIFKNIYDELTTKNGAKDYYEDNDTDKNYSKLREDWWTANRSTIWQAMTCSADTNSAYFRATCSDGKGQYQTHNKCRCTKSSGANADQVPTYFDYVPQYLRWFEEWTEDFCRLRKRKLEDAIQKCRKGEDGKEKYCDLNRHNCTQTIRGKHVFVEDDDCTNCSVACAHFVKWIDKQKLEIHKQKKKYETEISGGASSARRRRRRDAGSSGDSSNYDGYENKFYKILKETNYKDVEKFLEKLSKEGICQKPPRVGNETADAADFSGKNYVKTFSHTEYCQACPWCGAQKKSGGNGKWIAKSDTDCAQRKEYKPENITEIPVLYPDISQQNILKKYKTFCANDEKSATGTVNGGEKGKKGDQIKKWICYYDENRNKHASDSSGAINFCVLQDDKAGTSQEKSMHYNAFFWDWVYHMLHDSVEWRRELNSCINNNSNGNTCISGCKKKCDCFEKWVGQKEKELKQIKQHFGKQKDIVQEGFFDAGMTPDVLLEEVLNKEVLLENIEEDYSDPNEIKHIKKMMKEEEDEESEENVDENSRNKTTIDKLLKHEKDEAQKCLNTHKDNECKQAPTDRGGPGGRSLEDPQSPHHSDHEDSEDEEEDHGPDGEEPAAEDQDGKGEVPELPEPPATTQDEVSPCDIVAKIFEDITTLQKACSLKYAPGGKEKFPNWKCIPSDVTATSEGESGPTRKRREAPSEPTGSSGAICIPPRRRKLYVGKLEEWASDQKSPEILDVPSTSPSDKLRDAFIQSAAVETFFLWDRYKKEKKKPQGLPGLLPFSNLDDDYDTLQEDPQMQLSGGEIPEGFLRQMFYTLADYKDILDGKNIVVDLLSGSSGSDKEMLEKEQKIKDAIESAFSISGSKLPGALRGPPNSVQQRKNWWETNAKYIWEGMVCALTYKESGTAADGKKIDKVEGVNGKDLFDTLKGKYQYSTIKLQEETNGAKSTTQISAPSDTPLLSDFVKRPPYFRWLEEWGEKFCRQKARMLKNMKDNCRPGIYGHKTCSGDGFNCDDESTKKEDIFKPFLCSTCAGHCRFYKKWINTKRDEYNKQSNAYNQQKIDAQVIKDDNSFSTILENCTDAAAFLNKLKSGPCSKTNSESEEDNNKIFKDEAKTFQHTDLCDPCSQFRVKCNEGVCTGGDGTKVTCNRKNGHDYTTAKDFKNKGNSTKKLDMLVSDNNTNRNKFDDLQACASANIFKGIRKDVWKCGEFCGVDICTLEKRGKNERESNEHIIVKELLKRWLEYFFEDYNKINAKISHSTKNGEGSTCINGCTDKYKCVEQWVKEKMEEWKKIKQDYFEQNQNDGTSNNLKSFLEQAPFRNEVDKAIKPCKELRDFENSSHCNGTAGSKKSEEEKKKDIVECLLDKLEKEATSCKEKHSGSAEANCDNPPPDEEPDEDLLVEEDEQNTLVKQQPSFCPEIKPEQEDEGGCDPATTTPEETAPTTPKEPTADGGEGTEELPSAPPEEKAPVPKEDKKNPPKRRRIKTRNVLDHPAVIPSLATSTLMWTVGIGFAAFTYFFLKKKTKSSVGNLFQILQIPKSDYDIPTLKSSNRYIPYASDRHKGKTYIYMEGDSSGDEKYAFMSDTTDITSSESEYEELDINDIYVPGSPKYKTLIEVVLEPSKRDTPSSDTPMNKFTDDEWNQLKHDFISNMLQNQPNDIPNDYTSGNVTLNTQPNTLYFDNNQEKPFITSIHDRNLYTGEEINYNVNMVNNDNIPINRDNNVYSGIDLINDSLNNNNVDIYDELLKRKENELFGTNHPKHTKGTHNVAKNTNNDPIDNQLDLFHTWLDRHRDMCEQWNNKEEVLDKLKEEWNKDNNSGNIPSDSNKTLNTDVSIQIHMDNPKPINEFTNMDTILEDLEKYNEPYYDVQDDIYYDVHDHDTSTVDSNAMDVPSKVQIEMDINTKLVKEKYPIADVWDI